MGRGWKGRRRRRRKKEQKEQEEEEEEGGTERRVEGMEKTGVEEGKRRTRCSRG